ncbi:activator-dependent family glycosyltransferase [Streptomyces ardesiacus]|uniref:activator-dependent family glycosyltransferase n=1 Tax=Streptomyces ardesiacus TaxID=285564 RepID=UPI0033E42075
MRVLLTVFAAKPHLYNLISLAWALRASGHEVRVASQPDVTDAITRAGLTAVPVGDELNLSASFRPGEDRAGAEQGGVWQRLSGVTETRPEKLTWNYVLGTYTIGCSMEYEHMAGQTMMDDLVEHARAWRPDLVLWDALTFVGPVAARACGAAHARVLFGVDYNAHMLGAYADLLSAQPPQTRDDPLSDWLTGRLARYGLPFEPEDAVEMMTGQWTIDPTPAWMQLPVGVPLLPMRYVPYNGPSTVPGWVLERPRRPRVCMSLGMSGRELLGRDQMSIGDGASAEPPVSVLLRTLAELDIELVVTLSKDQLAAVSGLPDNVRAVDFVPLNDLLPTCAAVIHHGGFGTVGNVLTHGVPSITVPAPWWDETDLGRHIEARGAGLLVDPREASAEVLRAGVARLLGEPSFRSAAHAVRRELHATPSPRAVVPRVERLVAVHRSGSQLPCSPSGTLRGRWMRAIGSAVKS